MFPYSNNGFFMNKQNAVLMLADLAAPSGDLFQQIAFDVIK
jgi:hypothetical protein